MKYGVSLGVHFSEQLSFRIRFQEGNPYPRFGGYYKDLDTVEDRPDLPGALHILKQRFYFGRWTERPCVNAENYERGGDSLCKSRCYNPIPNGTSNLFLASLGFRFIFFC
jgi:hypothetical protein